MEPSPPIDDDPNNMCCARFSQTITAPGFECTALFFTLDSGGLVNLSHRSKPFRGVEDTARIYKNCTHVGLGYEICADKTSPMYGKEESVFILTTAFCDKVIQTGTDLLHKKKANYEGMLNTINAWITSVGWNSSFHDLHVMPFALQAFPLASVISVEPDGRHAPSTYATSAAPAASTSTAPFAPVIPVSPGHVMRRVHPVTPDYSPSRDLFNAPRRRSAALTDPPGTARTAGTMETEEEEEEEEEEELAEADRAERAVRPTLDTLPHRTESCRSPTRDVVEMGDGDGESDGDGATALMTEYHVILADAHVMPDTPAQSPTHSRSRSSAPMDDQGGHSQRTRRVPSSFFHPVRVTTVEGHTPLSLGQPDC